MNDSNILYWKYDNIQKDGIGEARAFSILCKESSPFKVF